MAKVAWGCYTVRSFFQAQHQGFCYNQSGHLHGEPTGFLLLRRFPDRNTHTHSLSPAQTEAKSPSCKHPPRPNAPDPQLRHLQIPDMPNTSLPRRNLGIKITDKPLERCPSRSSSPSASAVTDKIRLRLTSPGSSDSLTPPARAHTHPRGFEIMGKTFRKLKME